LKKQARPVLIYGIDIGNEAFGWACKCSRPNDISYRGSIPSFHSSTNQMTLVIKRVSSVRLDLPSRHITSSTTDHFAILGVSFLIFRVPGIYKHDSIRIEETSPSTMINSSVDIDIYLSDI